MTPPKLTSISAIAPPRLDSGSLRILGCADAGIVHQHIQSRELVPHARRQSSNLRGIGDVATDRVQLRISRFYSVEHLLPAPGDDDFVAELEKLQSECEANPGGAAGDEDGATSEIHRKDPFLSP